MEFQFQTDEDTERLLKVTVHFLQEYFGYEETQAVDLVNRYYNKMQLDDDDYHHQGPWHIAVLIHYVVGLQEDGRKFLQWRKDSGLVKTPAAAMEYARKHFYKTAE